MAKATRIPPEPVPVRYNLELSEKEATFLLDVTRNIGGDPIGSRRRHSDAIAFALDQAGAQHSEGDDIGNEFNGRRFIFFKGA